MAVLVGLSPEKGTVKRSGQGETPCGTALSQLPGRPLTSQTWSKS